MASRSSSVTSLILAAFFLTYAGHAGDAQTTSVEQSPDAVTTGLLMAIAPIEPTPGFRAPSAQFRVTIENDGDRDLIVNLGYMFGNGQVMLPTSLDLILTDPSGRARALALLLAAPKVTQDESRQVGRLHPGSSLWLDIRVLAASGRVLVSDNEGIFTETLNGTASNPSSSERGRGAHVDRRSRPPEILARHSAVDSCELRGLRRRRNLSMNRVDKQTELVR